jgi:GxxExxY protein
VHRALGPGFLESVYEEALAIELAERGIPFSRQHIVGVAYKGRIVGEGKLDFLVSNQLVVELKTVDTLSPIHTAQLLSYLKATQCRIGLVINFNVPILVKGIKRIVLD